MQGYQDFAMGEIFLVLESRIALRKSGILLLQSGIPDPRSTAKESEIQFLDSRIHSVESRIQDLHGAKRRNQYRGCSMSSM